MDIKPGYKFEKLTILAEGPQLTGYNTWHCQCDCGNITNIKKSEFKVGYHKSCGCLRGEFHNMSNSSEYQTWVSMMRRCFNSDNDNYSNYGGSGITVCERWLSFTNFYQDMGPKPTHEHSIERQNVNGNYEPGNCHWATRLEQANNKRNNVVFLVEDENVSRMDLCRKYNINRVTLQARIDKGMTLEEALSTPVRNINSEKIFFNGQEKTIKEWAEVTGISYNTIYQRLKVYGLSVAEALTKKV